jgi:hypothetical protein
MTPKKENSQLTAFSQTEFQEIVHEKMRQAVRFTLVTVLEAEMEAFIGARLPTDRAAAGLSERLLPAQPDHECGPD